MGNIDVPAPDAFSYEGNANWVVVYKLGYSVKFLHRVLAGQIACENSGDVLAFPCHAYHFAQLEDCASQPLLRSLLHRFPVVIWGWSLTGEPAEGSSMFRTSVPSATSSVPTHFSQVCWDTVAFASWG